jgi:hypothetical protein
LSEERGGMRHTLSRAFTVGRGIGILAAGAAALALPGTSTGRPAARGVAPLDDCAPAGTIVCDQLLDTIVVPAGSTGVPSKIDFSPNQPYRWVVSGVVHRQGPPGTYSGDVQWNEDLFYCFGATPKTASYFNCITTPQPSPFDALRWSGGAGTGSVSSLWGIRLPYSDTNTYEVPFTSGGFTHVVPPLSGTLTFSDHDTSDISSGAWTIKIYGPSTETVKFAASLHHRAHARHAFEVTNALGVGQIVVPTPKETSVKSTSGKGTIKFHKLKVSTKGVLLLDETNLTLAVKSAVFFPNVGGAPLLDINVVVTKSAGTDACPKGSPGLVVLGDGELTGEGDAFGIHIPACKLKEAFNGKPGGGAGKAGFVTVAITVVKPQPPA